MKKRIAKLSLIAALFAAMFFQILADSAEARSVNDGLGRTSFTWLKTISDAGISSAGGCFAARDGSDGFLVHPAAIAGITTGRLKMSYVSHYVDTQYGFIGYARNIKGRDMGIRLTYVNYGTFNGRDINNESTGTFSAGDIGLTFNIAKKVRDDLKFGVMASIINSKIDDYSAQAATVDIGAVYYPPFEGFTVGAALMNVGKVIKSYSSGYDETMPVYLSVGIKKRLSHAPLTLFTDAIFPNDSDVIYAYGVEISIQERMFIYVGTKSLSEIDKESLKSKTDFSGTQSFGFGLELKNYRFNYAYSPDNFSLGNIHKITLSSDTK
ncbi:PorV/PorQ family protein [Candidatus Latescibacterota bacterium]